MWATHIVLKEWKVFLKIFHSLFQYVSWLYWWIHFDLFSRLTKEDFTPKSCMFAVTFTADNLPSTNGTILQHNKEAEFSNAASPSSNTHNHHHMGLLSISCGDNSLVEFLQCYQPKKNFQKNSLQEFFFTQSVWDVICMDTGISIVDPKWRNASGIQTRRQIQAN